MDTNNKPILSLSKEKGDFIVQPFKGSGKGGQKRNKTMSACRIIHPASGAVSECQEERSFDQNRRLAFKRLAEKPKFKAWLQVEIARKNGTLARIDEAVNASLSPNNIRTEVQRDGKWEPVSDLDSLAE